jgi:hypothetical protein
MHKLIRQVSLTEVEYQVTTSDGAAYDVLLEVGFDRTLWYLPMFFRPNSVVRIPESHIPVHVRCELAELTESAFTHYKGLRGSELLNYFKRLA